MPYNMACSISAAVLWFPLFLRQLHSARLQLPLHRICNNTLSTEHVGGGGGGGGQGAGGIHTESDRQTNGPTDRQADRSELNLADLLQMQPKVVTLSS